MIVRLNMRIEIILQSTAAPSAYMQVYREDDSIVFTPDGCMRN